MAHVQFRTGKAATNGKAAQLIVDGVDITDHCSALEFQIGPSTGNEHEAGWPVRVTLIAEAVDADLPESLLRVREAAKTEAAS